MAKNKKAVCIILEGRLWYPFLLSPRLDEKTKEPRGFETGVITSPDFDSQAVRDLMREEGTAAWGAPENWQTDPPPNFAMKKADDFRGFKGQDGQVDEQFKGCRLFTVKSQFAPEVVDDMVQPLIDAKKVYGGVWARVTVTGAYSWESKGKVGVGLNLGPVQIWKDGPALGTKLAASSVFKAAPGAQKIAPAPGGRAPSPLDD